MSKYMDNAYFTATDKVGRSERYLIVRKGVSSPDFVVVAMAASLMQAQFLCEELNAGCKKGTKK